MKKSKKNSYQSHLKTEYFDCICSSSDHTIRFVYFADEDGIVDFDDAGLYLEVQLVQWRNIFKRIWVAIKYIFGYQCRYGHWDCWELRREDCKKFVEFLQKTGVDKI